MLIFDLALVNPGFKHARECYHSHTVKLSEEPKDGCEAGVLSFSGYMLCAWPSDIPLTPRLRKHNLDFTPSTHGA